MRIVSLAMALGLAACGPTPPFDYHDFGPPPDHAIGGDLATVVPDGGVAMGPLKVSASNPHYFVDPAGKAVLLTGSQTWTSFQDLSQSTTPAAIDFDAYVRFLRAHGHNTTILWRKDLPTYCGWGAGGTWHITVWPWLRSGGGTASDGLARFDLSQLDQSYFDRLRARAVKLRDNGIYAIVQLFDGLQLTGNRCGNTSPSGDGYPFTGMNNVNGADDGYTGGSAGDGSMTMTAANAITGFQDAYVKKVIDTVGDLPNVLWEISEEAPDNSVWWQGHMIALIHSYEAGKPMQHPVGFPSLRIGGNNDSTLYNSDADWVAPAARVSPTSSCGSGTPACKVNINDSDHNYYGLWNDTAQVNRNYVWENFANGSQVLFMDPYVIDWSGRNACAAPASGVCSGPDTRYDLLRDNLGYTLRYANKMNLVAMTPQPTLSSTGFALAAGGAVPEYLVYAPNGGTFMVDLSGASGPVQVEWFDPSAGTPQAAAAVTGGGMVSFTPPFGGDAVLYLKR